MCVPRSTEGLVDASASIPRIDISAAAADPKNAKVLEPLAELVAKAMDEYGCFILVNHGIPEDVCTNLEKVTAEFYDLPLDEKNEVHTNADDFNGFDSGETLYVSEDTNEFLQDKPQTDSKECYQVCPGVPASENERKARWPRRPEGFKDAWMPYYREMERLTDLVYRLFALALGREIDFFDALNYDHKATFRSLCYKPDPSVAPGALRCSVHSDWGPLTLLRQATGQGSGMYLQIVNWDGEWMDVKASSSEIVVNAGDMMEYWTSNKWRSIKHRVVQPEGGLSETRYSFAYFHAQNDQIMIDPRDFNPEATDPPVNGWDFVVKKKLATLNY